MILPIGIDNFEDLIKNKLDFVDKSLLIKEVLDDKGTKVAVITRPRRFGKSLNLSMLYYFLAIYVNGDSKAGLFDKLKISQCSDKYLQHQGRYPVISITLKDIKQNSFEDAREKFLELFVSIYDEHNYLLNSPHVTDTQKRFIDSVLNRKVTKGQLENALKMLTECLFKHFGIKPWLLIDEYDSPIQSGYMNGYYKEIIDFMRSLFGAALKSNHALEKSVITGILRIAKESLFSGVNNLKVYSVLNSKYSEYFGFTENEVDEILTKADLSEKAEQLKDWYNGYQIGETIIYNPWSIVNCVDEKGVTIPYWVNTSDNQLIKDLLKSSPIEFKAEFERLAAGKSVEKLIDENMVFQYLSNNPSSVWSLLLMAGYLKPASIRQTEQGVFAHLAIPNKEVRYLYRQIVEQWLSNGHGIEWYNKFIEALLTGKIEEFKKHLGSVITQITSYHDFAKEPEAFYQGLMLGFTVSLHSVGSYEIKSNRESGLGRFDIMLIPKDNLKLGIIIELKSASEKENLLKIAEKAIKQIDKQKYTAEFSQCGIKKIIKIGIGFLGKKFELCAVEEALKID